MNVTRKPSKSSNDIRASMNRLDADYRPGIPGIKVRPEQIKPGRRGRRDAIAPSTAADKAVASLIFRKNNVHAGVKYLHWLQKTYFSGQAIEPLDQNTVLLRGLQCRAGKHAQGAQYTRQLGFDANRWFRNVEIGMFRSKRLSPVDRND